MEIRRRRLGLAAVWAALVLLSGCASVWREPPEEEDNAYTRAQAMIVVATERNRYQNLYTDRIWQVELEDGETFETYLLGQIRIFLENVKIANLLAEERGISLTSGEKDRLRVLAETYYNGLSPGDIAYMGIRQEDAETMYRQYALANKTVGELTAGLDLEVSDSEAKVISVRMIQISSPEAASAVYRRVSQEGADFLSVARETSEGEEIELLLGRGELPETAEKAAFSLAPGELSPLTAGGDGWFYIFQCVSDYEKEATQRRKAEMYEERRMRVFQQIYSRFQSEHTVVFDDGMWEDIHFSADDDTGADNFFSLYREEFEDQSG